MVATEFSSGGEVEHEVTFSFVAATFVAYTAQQDYHDWQNPVLRRRIEVPLGWAGK
jgi:hypothetical protein